MFKKNGFVWIKFACNIEQWITINGWGKWKEYFVEDEIKKKKSVDSPMVDWKIGNVER